jgi:hypothetical protein
MNKNTTPDQAIEVKQGVDLREYRRYLVRSVAVAALNDSRVGVIMDISRSGLAFRYIDFNHGDDELLQGSSEVSIIHDTAKFSLLDLPCTIIRVQHQLPGFYISSMKMNKCCLRFGSLTPSQESQLEYFIAHFTDGMD